MSDLGPIPELDYDVLERFDIASKNERIRSGVRHAAADLDAYARAARERIEQLEQVIVRNQVALAHMPQVLADSKAYRERIEQLEGEVTDWATEAKQNADVIIGANEKLASLGKLLDEAAALLFSTAVLTDPWIEKRSVWQSSVEQERQQP